MPSIQRIVSVAGLATNANVFNSTDYERVPGTLRHQVRLVLGQIDGAADDIAATFTIGGRVVMPESGLAVDATNPNGERSTVVPSAVGNPGEIILLRLVNSNAAARIAGVRMILTPIAV